ncbi:Carboxylesterase type B [Pyrenophora seminiperda CCB06]|uniref:Carboxylic ester hydrolase n=1 Tax=Pyrenophora seminiperda CCB06 TaxID=1302712 RepID=A0A3M7M585_9PLEO|nr:Carboxylesterase type B [Pyrenophora seminiperda CCB06]
MSSLSKTFPTFTFEHAELGPMTGIIAPNNVVQFRAITFATIPGRFKQSALANRLSGKKDFTQPGCACPQKFSNDVTGGGLFPGELSPPPSDEFKCLILQLNIPLTCLQSAGSSSKLPVLVYIHGGGFIIGKIDEQHNTALMVEQSLLDLQPIISASIQYRLGAFGYLHTPEPGNGNLALNDQRNALLWIQKFIGGFGGDRNRVTLFGESAGSMSICAHMLSSPPHSGPLFQRAILMSGVIGPMTAPNLPEVANNLYDTFLKSLGIKERGEDGLKRLRELEVQKLVEASAQTFPSGRMWCSVQDQQWFGNNAGSVTWDNIPELISKCEWIDEIVLGTTSFEGTAMTEKVTGVTPDAFLSGITGQLGDKSAELLSQAYGITPDMDQNLFLTAALRWIGDVVFDAPTHLLSQYLTTHTHKKVYRYVFDVRNPFPGSLLYQQPHHWVDVYFVFKTFQFRYPYQRLKNISTQHSQHWISFANGRRPWSEYKYTGKGDEVVAVADDQEGWLERKVKDHEKAMETSWTRCETLVESWESKRGKAFSPFSLLQVQKQA